MLCCMGVPVGPPVGVCALVAERGEKFVQQISVGSVQFDDLEPGGHGTDRGGGKIANDAADFIDA